MGRRFPGGRLWGQKWRRSVLLNRLHPPEDPYLGLLVMMIVLNAIATMIIARKNIRVYIKSRIKPAPETVSVYAF